MRIFAIRDANTGLFFGQSDWVSEQHALVWTTEAKALLAIRRWGEMHPASSASPEVIQYEVHRSKPTVTLVCCDDWEALYIDGVLVDEEHHIRLEDILERLGIEAETIYPDDDWLEEQGCFPDMLAEIKESGE